MARSRNRARRARPPQPTFRSRVGTEVVEELLLRFATTVKQGLALMLVTPSELARKEFRRQPALVYTAADIAGLVHVGGNTPRVHQPGSRERIPWA